MVTWGLDRFTGGGNRVIPGGNHPTGASTYQTFSHIEMVGTPGCEPIPQWSEARRYTAQLFNDLGHDGTITRHVATKLGTVKSPEKQVNHAPLFSSQRPGHSSGSNNIDKGNKNGRSDSKDQKSEVQKSAKRILGDWSEHTSSSGKRYYYNCKTEVSQWEKPKEWGDVHVGRCDNKSKDSQCVERTLQSSKAIDCRNRHSSSSESSGLRLDRINVGAPDNKPDKKILFEKLHASQSKYSGLGTSQLHKMPFPVEHSKPEVQSVRKNISGKSESVLRWDGLGKPDSYTHSYLRKETTFPFSSKDYSAARRQRQNSEGSRSSGHITPRKFNDSQMDGMEISPGSTPTNSRPSCTGSGNTPVSITTPTTTVTGSAVLSATPVPLISSLPQIITQLSGGQNNQEMTQKALQTLQKLQEVLSHQIAHQKNSAANQMHSPRPIADNASLSQSMKMQLASSHAQHPTTPSHPPPTGQPHYSHVPPTATSPQQPLQVTGIYGRLSQLPDPHIGESPPSDGCERSCHSPAISNTSSQDAPVDGIALLTAPIKTDNSLGLTPSLSNYYNERFIGHVLGWQADHAERQANRYWEEGLSVGSLQCSQVSVDLKRARSLVRVSEIQTTLHEQRILFLAQQIKELESMKPPSFMLTQ